jgi:competence protein ComEC
MTRSATAALAVVLIGCGGSAPAVAPAAPQTQAGAAVAPASSAVAAPASAAPIAEAPVAPKKPGPGTYLVHVVDVGSGLGIFVDGPDFTLVYDAGSNDDTADGDKNRFVAYLKAVRPDLKQIDHVVIGHPHPDHVSLLGDVLSRFDVKEVWDSGISSAECTYQQIIKTIKERNITYHSAMQGPGDRRVNFKNPCEGIASGYQIKHADRVETGLRVKLGEASAMTFSYAASKPQVDPNDNSLAVRLDLGKSRLLIMGDVGAGGRGDVDSPPKKGSVEGELLRTKSDIRSDVLVVGNHGSTASSRKVLVDVINPKVSVISSGPTPYGGIKLPEAAVVEMLNRRGSLFRTDRDDAACGTNGAKIGPDADGKPGGCDNVTIVLQDGVAPKAAYWTAKD